MSAARVSAVVKMTLAQLKAGEPIEQQQLDVLAQNLELLVSSGAAADFAKLIDSKECDFFSSFEKNFFLRLLGQLAVQANALGDAPLVATIQSAINRYVNFAFSAAQSLDHHAGKNPAFLFLVNMGEELGIDPKLILIEAENLIFKKSVRSDAWATKMIDCLGTLAARKSAKPYLVRISDLAARALSRVPKEEQSESVNRLKMLMLLIATRS